MYLLAHEDPSGDGGGFPAHEVSAVIGWGDGPAERPAGTIGGPARVQRRFTGPGVAT